MDMQRLWEQWGAELQKQSSRFRSEWVQPKLTDLPRHELDGWWDRSIGQIDSLTGQNTELQAEEAAWTQWLLRWKTALTLIHEWVLVYEASKEKVSFADVFGLYYRSQSMIEPDALIHSQRWVNRLTGLQAPLAKTMPEAAQPYVEELMRNVCQIWKSPIPEQQWISAWLFWSLKDFASCASALQQSAAKSAVPWINDLIEDQDDKVRLQFAKLSPLLRVRQTAIVVYLLNAMNSSDPSRMKKWLEWVSGFISYIPAAESEHLWVWWERWISRMSHKDGNAEPYFLDLLLQQLPTTKPRLIAYAYKMKLPRLRTEIELLTDSDPMLWDASDWKDWKSVNPKEALPILHHRLEQIMKLKASERESVMEWVWNELQSVYLSMNREETWRHFVSGFDQRYGRTRVGRSLREKEGTT